MTENQSHKLRNFMLDVFEHHETRIGRAFGLFLITLVCLSTFLFILETTAYGEKWVELIHKFDIFVISVFAIEYLARLFLARNKIKHVFSVLSMIDFLVIASFFLSLASVNLLFLRGFRVLKIFQLLKIVRYSDTMLDFFKSFKNYTNELKIFGITFSVVLVLSSCGLYYLEKDANGSFATIPDAIWWAVVTITTVGYGDAIPVTVGGKVLGGIVMFMGLGIIAILTAIVTKMFIDHFFGKQHHHCTFCRYPRHDFDAKFCKNCGGELDKNRNLIPEA